MSVAIAGERTASSRQSSPPKVGTAVKILVEGYLKGQTGQVTALSDTDEHSRHPGGKVRGQSCRVRLHHPIPTRWQGAFVEDVLALWGWDIEPLKELR